MKFTTLIAFLAAGVIATVKAEENAGIYITQPILETVWNAGMTHSINWIVSNSSASDIETIELRRGPASNIEYVDTISTSPISLSASQFDWAIPSNLTTTISYVLIVKTNIGSSYSAYFTIIGLAPGVQEASTASIFTSIANTSTVSNAALATNTGDFHASTTLATDPSITSSVDAHETAPLLNRNVKASGAMTLKASAVGIIGAISAAIFFCLGSLF